MRRALVALSVCVLALTLAACSSGTPSQVGNEKGSALAAYPLADMSGYACAADYDADYNFVEMTVADVAQQMEAGKSFAVYAGFSNCPWCNVVLNTLNDVAAEYGHYVGYIDTRKNPAWQTNLDIDDYDVFAELFGDALPLDDQHRPHLYVPQVFFVKDGVMVYDHAGTAPGQDSPSDPLTEQQAAEIADYFRTGFDKIS